MKFNTPEHVQHVIDQLAAVGIEATLVGGALRDAALGGGSDDYDLAIFGDRENFYSIDMEVGRLGFKNFHHDEYACNEGYVADWRNGDINLIMYDEVKIGDVEALIGVFDLNINQWYVDEDGELQNDSYDPKTKLVVLNPKRDALGHIHRLSDRIEKFKSRLPDLDWSDIESRRRVMTGLYAGVVHYV